MVVVAGLLLLHPQLRLQLRRQLHLQLHLHLHLLILVHAQMVSPLFMEVFVAPLMIITLAAELVLVTLAQNGAAAHASYSVSNK